MDQNIPDDISPEGFNDLVQQALARGHVQHIRDTTTHTLEDILDSVPDKAAELVLQWLDQGERRKLAILLAAGRGKAPAGHNRVSPHLPRSTVGTVLAIADSGVVPPPTTEELTEVCQETVSFIQNPPLGRELGKVLAKIEKAAVADRREIDVWLLNKWHIKPSLNDLPRGIKIPVNRLTGTAALVFDFCQASGLKPAIDESEGGQYHIKVFLP